MKKRCASLKSSRTCTTSARVVASGARARVRAASRIVSWTGFATQTAAKSYLARKRAQQNRRSEVIWPGLRSSQSTRGVSFGSLSVPWGQNRPVEDRGEARMRERPAQDISFLT